MDFRPNKHKVVITLLFAIILIFLLNIITSLGAIGLSDSDLTITIFITSYIFTFIFTLIAGMILWLPITLIFYFIFSLFQKNSDIKKKTGNWGFTKDKTIAMIIGFLIPLLSLLFFYSSFGVPISVTFLSAPIALIPGFIVTILIYFIWSLNQKKEIKTKKTWLILFVALMILITLITLVYNHNYQSSLCLMENPQDCDNSCKVNEDCGSYYGSCLNKNQNFALKSETKTEDLPHSKFECECVDGLCQYKDCRGKHYGCTDEDIPCCEGLKEVSCNIRLENGQCVLRSVFKDKRDINHTFCSSKCGDGKCESSIDENVCSCPEDCL